jgi:hypothetical protein
MAPFGLALSAKRKFFHAFKKIVAATLCVDRRYTFPIFDRLGVRR